LRVHAQIEWTIVFVGETTRGVVHLHGRDSKVRENNIGWFGENSRKTSKICPVHGKGVRTKSKRAESSFGFRQFDGIDVEAHKPAARL
jgi:hypothetical protein